MTENNREESLHVFDEVEQRNDPMGYYLCLGVSRDADASTIRKAFLHHSVAYHSDKHANCTPEDQSMMNLRFQQINEAYQVLCDERRRSAYDSYGKVGLDRLALVPAEAIQKEDVSRQLNFLEREAELKRTAALVSAEGIMRLSFNLAPFLGTMPEGGPQRKRRPRGKPSLPSQFQKPSSGEESKEEGERGRGVTPSPITATATQPPPPPAAAANTEKSPVAPAAEGEAEAEPQPPSSPPQPGAAVPAQQQQQQQPKPMQMQAMMGVRQVVLDGVPTIVLIPNDDIQKKLQEQVGGKLAQQQQQQQQGGGAGLSPGGPFRPSPFVPVGVQIAQAFQQPLGQRTLLVASANASLGAKQHSTVQCKFALHHTPSSTTSHEWILTFKNALPQVKLNYTRVLSAVWSYTARFVFLSERMILPQFTLELRRKLTSTWSLANSLRWSLLPGVGFFHATLAREDNSRSVGVAIGPGTLSLTASAEMPAVFQPGTSLEKPGRTSVSVQTDLVSQRCSISYEFWYFQSQLQRFGFGVSSIINLSRAPVPNATQFELLYQRGKHRVQLPIIVSLSTRLATAVELLLVPVTLYRVTCLISRPLVRLHVARKARESRRLNKQALMTARQRALDEQRLLHDIVEARRMAEESVPGGGLIVINAKYGVLRPMIPNLDEDIPLTIDVTTALQNYVKDSKLMMSEGPKHVLPGFYDPDPFSPEVEKKLHIVYWFKRLRHEAIIGEHEPVQLPQERHLMRDAQ